MRLISWNLFHRRGAVAADISALIAQYSPDLVIMQEAVNTIDRLPKLAGGHFHSLPWPGKRYGLAVWTAEDAGVPESIELPFSRLPATFPQRLAQVIEIEGISIANVHLSHGQWLNRRQLRQIAQTVSGPLAIVGDFNALGPIIMRGFSDIGPRRTTHYAQRVLPLRLDRCLARGLDCVTAETLERGASDHRPILIELERR